MIRQSTQRGLKTILLEDLSVTLSIHRVLMPSNEQMEGFQRSFRDDYPFDRSIVKGTN